MKRIGIHALLIVILSLSLMLVACQPRTADTPADKNAAAPAVPSTEGLSAAQQELAKQIVASSPDLSKAIMVLPDNSQITEFRKKLGEMSEDERLLFTVLASNASFAFLDIITKLQSDEMPEPVKAEMKKFLGDIKNIHQQARKKQPSNPEEMLKEILSEKKDFEIPEGAISRGNPNAPIQVVLFTEFLCPFCARVDPIIEELFQQYGPETMRVVFMSLIVHGPVAELIHRAAYAAGRQGKFWEYSADLFATQREWSKMARESEDKLIAEVLRPKAEKLGLDLKKFDADMNDDAIKAQLKAEGELAGKLGVQGTPNVFINGHHIKGALPKEMFVQVVDAVMVEKGLKAAPEAKAEEKAEAKAE